MICPKCQVEFHPQTRYQFLGQNGNGKHGALYWQTCPKCKEFLVFLKETKDGNIVLGELQNSEALKIIYPN